MRIRSIRSANSLSEFNSLANSATLSTGNLARQRGSQPGKHDVLESLLAIFQNTHLRRSCGQFLTFPAQTLDPGVMRRANSLIRCANSLIRCANSLNSLCELHFAVRIRCELANSLCEFASEFANSLVIRTAN